jgi:hypothetical protein
LVAGPDCCLLFSGNGRTDDTGSCPTICAWIVSAAGIRNGAPVYPPQMIISLPVHTAV